MTEEQMQYLDSLDEIIAQKYADLMRVEEEIRQYSHLIQIAEHEKKSILARINTLRQEKADWRTEIFDTREVRAYGSLNGGERVDKKIGS